MKQTLFTHWAWLTICLVLVACQPILPAQPLESTGEKVLKTLVREGVTLNMNEFTANSGLFSVNAPPDWVTAEHDDGSGVIMATSDAALERFQRGEAPMLEDAVVSTTLVPLSFFGTLLIEVESGLDTAELAAAIMPAFSGSEDAEASEPQVIALGGGREAAATMSINESAEGAMVLFEISEGVVALSTIVSHPGELDTEDVETVARVIIGSLEFTGTVDELIKAIDPVQPPDGSFG